MTNNKVVSGEEAAKLISAGKAKSGMSVDGILNVSQNKLLKKLPKGLKAFELDASETALETLPADINIECSITLRDCKQLVSLPDKITTGSLDLRGCSSLTELPTGLNVWFLDIQGCTGINRLPKSAKIENGGLNVSGCASLKSLPAYIKKLGTLDISDCPMISTLPKNLRVGLWIDVGGSGIKSLPESLKNVGIRWRGVQINERIAFEPESITSREILKETNTEVRRVMIEQMGLDKFISEAGAKSIDKDADPGGVRELVRLPLEDDEDLVCLSCFCPSTKRHYFLRVPPTTKTCHQAAAWMAGFDDPKKYDPVIET